MKLRRWLPFALLVVPAVALAQDEEAPLIQLVALFAGVPIGLGLLAMSALELMGAFVASRGDEPALGWAMIGRVGLLLTLATLLLFCLPMAGWFVVFGVLGESAPDMYWSAGAGVVMLILVVISYVCSRVLVTSALNAGM